VGDKELKDEGRLLRWDEGRNERRLMADSSQRNIRKASVALATIHYRLFTAFKAVGSGLSLHAGNRQDNWLHVLTEKPIDIQALPD